MRKTRLFSFFTLVIFLSIIILFIPFCKEEKSEEPKVTKIGIILPLTGAIAFWGEGERNAIMLLNEMYPQLTESVKFIFEDSQASIKEGVTTFQKLNQDGVDFFIVSLTRMTEAVKPLIQIKKDLIFSLSVHPDIAKDNDSVFRVYYGLEDQIPFWFSLMKEKGAKTVATISVRDASVDKVVEIFEEACKSKGYNFLGKENYEISEIDIRPYFEKIINLNPDIIISLDFGNLYPQILKEAKARNMKDRIIGGLEVVLAPNIEPELIEGIIIIGPHFVIHNTPEYRSFLDKYTKKYGKPASYDAAITFISGYIMLDAIKNAGTNGEKLIDYIKGRTFLALGEKITFDLTGTSRFPLSIGIFESGKIVPYQKTHQEQKNEK